MAKDGNLHQGHRQKVRKRYMEEGLENFEEHEILELLLFYTVPRRDTNELAHRMLRCFGGSLIALLNADPKTIVQTCKVSESTAVYLSMISDVVKYYIQKSNLIPKKLDRASAIQKFAAAIFSGGHSLDEALHLICLNAHKVLIADVELESNLADAVNISMKTIIEEVVKHKAKFVILAHNHPGGTLMPSSTDIKTTELIKGYLESIGVRLLDHIIVADGQTVSFASNGLCKLSYSSV